MYEWAYKYLCVTKLWQLADTQNDHRFGKQRCTIGRLRTRLLAKFVNTPRELNSANIQTNMLLFHSITTAHYKYCYIQTEKHIHKYPASHDI